MANQQALSDDEVQLRRKARRRLIGAVTLVTVMVVALPMLLDGEPKQSGQDIVINIPPQTSGSEFSSKIVPVPEQPAANQAQEPAPALAPAAPSTPPPQPMAKKAEMPAAAQPAKAEEPGGKKSAAAAAEAQSGSAAPHQHDKDEKPAAAKHDHDGGPYVVQLGAFSNAANADDRKAKLTALKVKFYTETVKTPGGDKLRVRAGPYATRQEAERVQAKLKASGIQDGVVAEKKG